MAIKASEKIDYPRLRHCTFVFGRDDATMTMIVGRDHFQIGEEYGDREDFLNVKRYFDGRHSIDQISRITGVAEADVRAIVETFAELGLLRREEPTENVPVEQFLSRIDDTCLMWARQIGYHPLFERLVRGEARKEVFLGLVLETYHYVKSAGKHAAVALQLCDNPRYEKLLEEYLTEERDHSELFVTALERMGVPRNWTTEAHPIIGTMSLVNALCDIGRESTLAYIACTALFEARREDFEGAKASFEQMAQNYGYDADTVAPIIQHMADDVSAGHTSLIREALEGVETIPAREVHDIVNRLHDLKHSFDQQHADILLYYGDISNYIPRLKVDYFSL
jgi:TENA/THI-4/PQQC family